MFEYSAHMIEILPLDSNKRIHRSLPHRRTAASRHHGITVFYRTPHVTPFLLRVYNNDTAFLFSPRNSTKKQQQFHPSMAAEAFIY